MNLFDPVRIGTLEAKNHFLRSATYEGAATEDGRPTDKILSLFFLYHVDLTGSNIIPINMRTKQ